MSSAPAMPSPQGDLLSQPGAKSSAAAPPPVSALSPWAAPFIPASALQSAVHDDVENINLQDAPRVAPRLPQLRLSDLVAAVLHTDLSQVCAVAAHLKAGFHFDLSRKLLQLILVCMYAAWLGVACHLKEQALTQHPMRLADGDLLRLAYENIDLLAQDDGLDPGLLSHRMTFVKTVERL